jgi:hypothetical protein
VKYNKKKRKESVLLLFIHVFFLMNEDKLFVHQQLQKMAASFLAFATKTQNMGLGIFSLH